MLPVIRFAGLALFTLAAPAAAHGVQEHGPTPGWTFEPLVIAPLALLLIIFWVGFVRLGSRSSVARRGPWTFVGGWLVLTLSLVSPLHEGGEISFTLHMIEHELIMLVATFLLAASRAGGILAWGLPGAMRRGLSGSWKAPFASLWRRLTEPVTATVIQAVAMWAWHAPALFDRTLTSQGWHVAQHMSFILASLVFWTAMLEPRRGSCLLSAACLFATSLVEGALGALMALSTSPWYAAYAAMGLSGIGLDPVTDQQLAGLIMWVPGGLIHGGAALVLLYVALKTSERSHATSAS